MTFRTAAATTLAGLAGLAGGSSAMAAAGDLSPVQAIVNTDFEVVSAGGTGNTAIIIVSLNDVGVNVASAYDTDGVFQVQLLDATGANLGGLINIDADDVSEHTDAGTAGTAESGDLVQINMSPVIQTFGGAAYGFDIIFNDGDAGDDSLVVDPDGFPGEGDDSDSNDTSFEINRTAPTLTQGLLENTDADPEFETLFLVFNFEPLGPGDDQVNSLAFPSNAGVANPNNTLAGSLDLNDFEWSTNGLTWNPFTAADIASVGAIADGQIFVQIDIGDPLTTNLSVGRFVRVVPASGNVTDGTGLLSTGSSAMTALAALDVSSAQFLATVDAGAGPIADVVEVTMNVALATPGNAAFWDGLVRSSATATDLTVTDADLDPSDSTKVLLAVQSGGTDSIAADGREGDGTQVDDGDSFDLEVDAMTGVPPTDIFANPFSGTADVDIDDGIAPQVTGALVGLDVNGDGVLDAIGIPFSEPMDVANADDAGFTLTSLAVTTHPISLFQTNLATGLLDPTDVANERTLVGANTFQDAITTYALESEDDDNRLTTDNAVVVNFNPAVASFQDASMNDASPGTFDVDWAAVVIDASSSMLGDANGVAYADDLALTNVSEEEAPPFLAQVRYNAGDNELGGTQRVTEQDGVVGDADDNNIARFVFSEPLDTVATAANIDESRFRFGTGGGDLFSSGDFVGVEGAGDNVVRLDDTQAAGFDPGDAASILSNSGVEDANGVVFDSTAASVTVDDSTAPYIALQKDVNGDDVLSAFLIDQDSDGFADLIRLVFTKDIGSTVDDADFSVQSVDQGDTSVSTSDNVVTIALPSLAITQNSTVTVTYNGSAAAEPIADSDGNEVAAINAAFNVQAIPTPEADGEFTEVMNVSGVITGPDGGLADAGTKVFAMIAAPVVKDIRGTQSSVTFSVSDPDSTAAFTNWVLGLSEFVYLYDSQGDMFFQNVKRNDSQDSLQLVTPKFTSFESVTWTGKGVTTPGGVDSVPAAVTSTTGTTRLAWDVLRSGDGTAASLFNDGYDPEGAPIVSSTVLTADDGSYLLHVTAPVSALNGTSRLNAQGWPVIIVVELPTGERYIATSLTNASDAGGPILFGAQQRSQTSAGDALSDVGFDINLQTGVNIEQVHPGWNLLSNDRNSGYAKASANVPDVLPRGLTSTNVVLGTLLNIPNDQALSQFCFFIDDDGDGLWTSGDDDSSRLDSVLVDVNCTSYIAFVMNSDGVAVSSPRSPGGITTVVGGYGLGVLNRSSDTWGAFQFGTRISQGTVFNSADIDDLNNTATAGWALVTAANSQTPAAFLTANSADFIIEFNRTSDTAVNITTFDSAGDGDAGGVNRGQAYFVHFPN
jgi:hypothetical protein